MTNHQMRFNQVTGRWVIYAPSRGERPHDHESDHHTSTQPQSADQPAHDPSCPFCIGNEDQLSAIILEKPSEADKDWQTRVIPNKFPVVDNQQQQIDAQRALFVGQPAQGQHEVIIETPQHNRDIPDADLTEVKTLMDTYHERYCTLLERNNTQEVVLFRNHGEAAGTSLRHPHSQIVAISVVSQRTRQHQGLAKAHYQEHSRDLIGDVMLKEMEADQRIVASNSSFTAFVPFAAEVPYEIWIVPRLQQANFRYTTDQQRQDLAYIIQDLLTRFAERLDDPDYNLIFHSSPQNAVDVTYLRWYVRIRPRTITRAGFELGTGIRVNPTLPEDNATMLLRR